MRIEDPGHIYFVQNVDGSGEQRIRFVRRRDSNAELLKTDSREEGILAQELVRVLIDRTLYLNAEAPCVENVSIVNDLRNVLVNFEARAARRTIEKKSMPERATVCRTCQHILCDHK
jgi:hypothetical protein